MTSQYETNLWSTHVNIVRLAEPIRHCIRWRMQVFKIEGFVCKRFLPFSPSFIFWFSFNFSRDQNWKSPSTASFCSETKRKCLLCSLLIEQLTDCAVGYLTGWRNDWLSNWLTDCAIGYLTSWHNDWLSNRLTDWLSDCAVGYLTDWQNDWLNNWLTDEMWSWVPDWLTEWLIEQLTDWLWSWVPD